jgi:uncharacterized membrane protein YgdD (TMEM256/DUF423 family)
MKPEQLYKASAVAGILGGAGIVLVDLAQIAGVVRDATVGRLEIPITLVILLALPALYVRQAPRAGVLGLVGFVLTFAGVALGMGYFYMMAFVRPVLGELWPPAAQAVSSAAAVMRPFEGLTFILGWLVFGAATLRARVLPRAAASLIIVGIVLVVTRELLPVRGPLGGLLMGLGITWLSVALFRRAAAAPAGDRG